MSRRGRQAVIEEFLDRMKRAEGGKAGAFEAPLPHLLPELPDDFKQTLAWEREYLGAYLSGHPIEQLNLSAPHGAETVNGRDHEERFITPDDTWIEVAGVATDVELKKTRRGNMMAVFGIEMLDGVINCISFANNCDQLADGWVIKAKGVIDDSRDERQVKVTNIKYVERW